MFDRFTDRARKVMALARKEAQRFNHDFIGTEHILLGLIQEVGLNDLYIPARTLPVPSLYHLLGLLSAKAHSRTGRS